MRRSTTRKEFLQNAFLTTLGAGLLACADRQRLAEAPPVSDAMPPPAEPPPQPAVAPTPTPELHEALFYVQKEEERVQCQVCFRQCLVGAGKRGFCGTKVNVGGRYYSLVYGRPSALQIDPIEKEPAFHVLPDTTILCTGTAGCNNRCRFCQNWELSQSAFEQIEHYDISPERTIRLAREQECRAVSFTYNEPTVFYEHMLDVAKLARQAGLKALFHTNGSMNEAPLAALLQHMDAVTVDLKAFTAEFYERVSSSRLEPVLRTLRQIYQAGVHLEIVNLVIPTLNDDMKDIRRMCRWIVSDLGREVPLHFTRFFPAYKLARLPATPIPTLESAARIADEEGLQFVYVGNCPGHERNSTFCPQCQAKIIERIHFAVLTMRVDKGRCGFCGHKIPGIWE